MTEVSYYSWGGSCPNNLIFNYQRYKKGECSYVDYRFWKSWQHHGEQGKLCGKWFDFRVAYSWFIHQSQLRSFINTHRGNNWVFETDASGTHEFDENMSFTTRHRNAEQMVKDGNHNMQDPSVLYKRSVSRGRRVMVFKDNIYLSTEFSATEVERKYGMLSSTVSQCCHAKCNTHSIQKGPYKGYSFYFEDKYKED